MIALPARPRVVLAGATGAVGRELLLLLEERGFPLASLKLCAGPGSEGGRLSFRGKDLPLEVLADRSFEGADLAFFSCGGELAKHFAPRAAEEGAVVIDNSSAFRLEPGVPLVVPEVNAGALLGASPPPPRLLANPNCSTILLVLVLAPLARAFGLRRVVVSTYQAASGAGSKGMKALCEDGSRVWGAAGGAGGPARGLLDFSEGHEKSREVFHHPLAFNLVPQVDHFLVDGSTREEWKMAEETRKILGLQGLRVEATCVRVPVLRSHSESVSIETEREAAPAEARRILGKAPGIEVQDDPERKLYPMPSLASGRSPVFVGRIRRSGVFEKGLALWLSGDQLLKGAALNAVQIAEEILPA